MLFSTISLLSLSSTAAAAALAARTVSTGSWQLVTKPPGDSTAIAIPIVIAPHPENNPTGLATGDPSEVPLCIELTPTVDWDGVALTGAKVANHPSVAEDIWMWKTIGAKQLFTSTRINITGTRGNWMFVSDPGSADMLLSLDGDTVAGVSMGGRIVHFGSDIPAAVGAVAIEIVGIPVDSCELYV